MATAVRMSAGMDKLCWETSGRRKQASERARNTEQHSSMSRKELNVGLANVCTAAWVSTWEGKRKEGKKTDSDSESRLHDVSTVAAIRVKMHF